MEEHLRNGAKNHDLHRHREDHAIEIFQRINTVIEAERNRGRLWRKLASEETGEMMYFLHRLAAATGTDQSIGSDDVSQPAIEGFEYHLVSGVACRCICEGNICDWELESICDNVDINHIKVAEDYEGRPVHSNGERDVRITTTTEENITIWVRVVKHWSRPDGNMLSIQTLWNGTFPCAERVLKFLEDVNTVNSIQILHESFAIHPHMRQQYITRHEANPVAASFSAVDSFSTVHISQELVATKEGDHGDGGGLFCAICHEMIFIGDSAKQLPCDHIFHYWCIRKWFQSDSKLSCPLCRSV